MVTHEGFVEEQSHTLHLALGVPIGHLPPEENWGNYISWRRHEDAIQRKVDGLAKTRLERLKRLLNACLKARRKFMPEILAPLTKESKLRRLDPKIVNEGLVEYDDCCQRIRDFLQE